ncbi:MAG TPA: L,D-transpeptidase [Sunxiuqinia sp.]|nr:L,D-transpeptidase [Sunxiuqinia sp.]
MTKKKEGKSTRFFHALVINYPNENDLWRLFGRRKNGTLPGSAGAGGMIELHGDGGRGVDWTDGCIALKNDDMEKLYQAVDVGTPVVIVGSLRPLSEIERLK